MGAGTITEQRELGKIREPWIRSLTSPSMIAIELAKIIREAHDEVLICAGKLLPGLYNEPRLAAAIEAALERGVIFRVLVGPDHDKTSSSYKLLKDYITEAKSSPPMHFAVVDSKHIRVEDKHKDEDILPPNSIAWDVPEAAKHLVELFNFLVENLAKGTDE